VALFLIFFKPLTLNQLLVVLRVVLVGVLVFSVLSLPGLRLNSADYGIMKKKKREDSQVDITIEIPFI
jgi:hypothetical protein